MTTKEIEAAFKQHLLESLLTLQANFPGTYCSVEVVAIGSRAGSFEFKFKAYQEHLGWADGHESAQAAINELIYAKGKRAERLRREIAEKEIALIALEATPDGS